MHPKSTHRQPAPQAQSLKQQRRAFRAELLRDFRFLAYRWQDDDAAYRAATHKHGHDLHRRHGAPLKPRDLKRTIDGNADLAFFTPARASAKACKTGGKRSGAARYDKNADKRAEAIKLAQAGQTCREIADALSVGKSTVNYWTRGVRFEAPDGKRRKVSNEGIVQQLRVKGEKPEAERSGSLDKTEGEKSKGESPSGSLDKPKIDYATQTTLNEAGHRRRERAELERKAAALPDLEDVSGSLDTPPNQERPDHAPIESKGRRPAGTPTPQAEAAAHRQGRGQAPRKAGKKRGGDPAQLTMFDVGHGYGYD